MTYPWLQKKPRVKYDEDYYQEAVLRILRSSLEDLERRNQLNPWDIAKAAMLGHSGHSRVAKRRALQLLVDCWEIEEFAAERFGPSDGKEVEKVYRAAIAKAEGRE